MESIYDPHVNETLRSIGLSQIEAKRPDGLFGHIVYDYKAPGTLNVAGNLQSAKGQLEGYLDRVYKSQIDQSGGPTVCQLDLVIRHQDLGPIGPREQRPRRVEAITLHPSP